MQTENTQSNVSGETRPPTFGERAVGLTFNPSNDPTVAKLKQLYAKIIDILTDGNLDNGTTGLKGRFLGRAINDTVAAQMWAVKAVTFIE
jgi:hypothetical protein